MWNRSLVQVQCMRQGAQGWCTGMTQRGREVGGGFRMGTHVCPWLIHVSQSVQSLSHVWLFASPRTAARHVNIWQNPPQYCKVISLQLNWINYLKRKERNPEKNKVWQNIKFYDFITLRKWEKSETGVGLTAGSIHSRTSVARYCLVLGTHDKPGQEYYLEIQEEIDIF